MFNKGWLGESVFRVVENDDQRRNAVVAGCSA